MFTSSQFNSIKTFPLRKYLPLILYSSVIFIFQNLYGARIFDDAFISMRFARNIMSHNGFVYNVGQPVQGTTTPLYTLVLAGLGGLLGVEKLPQIAWVAGMLAEVINVILIARLSKWIFGNDLWGVLFVGLYIFHPIRMDVASGGMETPLFITILLLMYDRFLIGRQSLWTGLWVGLALWMRLDAVLAIAPLAVTGFFLDYRKTIRWLLMGVCVFLPWLAWAQVYFGSVIPHTIIAKQIAYSNPPGHALIFLLTFFATGSLNISTPGGIILGLTGLLSIVIFWGFYHAVKNRREMLALAAYPFIYSGVMSWQNPAMWFPWYYPPLLIGFVYLLVAGIHYLTGANKPVGRMMLVLVVFMVGSWHYFYRTYSMWDPARKRESSLRQACVDVENLIAPGTTVLAPEIGVVGWYLPDAFIYDAVGLVTPEMLPYLFDLDDGEWISPDFVIEYKPDLIIGLEFFYSSLRADPRTLQGYVNIPIGKVEGYQNKVIVFKRATN